MILDFEDQDDQLPEDQQPLVETAAQMLSGRFCTGWLWTWHKAHAGQSDNHADHTWETQFEYVWNIAKRSQMIYIRSEFGFSMFLEWIDDTNTVH